MPLTDREASLCVELELIIPYAPMSINRAKLLKWCEHYHYTVKELDFALVDLARLRNLTEVGEKEYCFASRG